jgi:hypothetical protein
MNCTICKGLLHYREWDTRFECENCGESFDEQELLNTEFVEMIFDDYGFPCEPDPNF